MNALTDPYAEAVVAGCAIDNPEAAQLAHARLTAGDFYDPALADLFACSTSLPVDIPNHAADPALPMLHQQRAQAAAERCGIHPADIDQILAWRPVMTDTAGTYATRVATAAQARRLARALEQARLDLEAGAELDDVRDVVRQIVETT